MKRWRRYVLLVLLVVAGALTLIERSLSKPVPQNQYRGEPCGGEEDPFCVCEAEIGGANCAGGGFGRSWGVQCDESSCYAWIDCGDGELIDCDGEYEAQADYTGVQCTDTGNDPLAERDYC